MKCVPFQLVFESLFQMLVGSNKQEKFSNALTKIQSGIENNGTRVVILPVFQVTLRDENS